MQDNARRVSPGTDTAFICPSCRSPLAHDAEGWTCVQEQICFRLTCGIPDFIAPGRREAVERFLSFYRQVRKAEGWKITDRDGLINLPGTAAAFKNVWKLRERSFALLLRTIQQGRNHSSSRILDLGAGNCWMAYRLATGQRSVVAVDVNLDPNDGLGVPATVLSKQEQRVAVLRAEYTALPFPDRSFDIVCFNASLHYVSDPVSTVLETLRLVRENGSLYVLDSPLYRNPASGFSMLKERQERYRVQFGIDLPDDLAGGFLTGYHLDELRSHCAVEVLRPDFGFLWNIRPIIARAWGRREPAQFPLLHIRP